jgi:hypothetical protein
MKKLLLIAIVSSTFGFTGLNGMVFEHDKVIEECSTSKDPNACFQDNVSKCAENIIENFEKRLSQKEVYVECRSLEMSTKKNAPKFLCSSYLQSISEE